MIYFVTALEYSLSSIYFVTIKNYKVTTMDLTSS